MSWSEPNPLPTFASAFSDDYSAFSDPTRDSVFEDSRSMAPSTIATSISHGGDSDRGGKSGDHSILHNLNASASSRCNASDVDDRILPQESEPGIPRRDTDDSHPPSTGQSASNFISSHARAAKDGNRSQQQTSSMQVPHQNTKSPFSSQVNGTLSGDASNKRSFDSVPERQDEYQEAQEPIRRGQTSNAHDKAERAASPDPHAVMADETPADHVVAPGYSNIATWEQTEYVQLSASP